LIVHSGGRINKEYIAKAAGLARGRIGDLAVVDERYFKLAMSIIKDIYSEIYAIVRRKYSEDQKIDGVFVRMRVVERYANAYRSAMEEAKSS
jgi:hypothetical protein